MVQAGLGIAPWDVLTQGLQLKTGLGFGLLVILTSLVVLLLWIPIRQRIPKRAVEVSNAGEAAGAHRCDLS